MPALGIITGAGFVFRGIAFVARSPKLYRHAVVPALAMLVVASLLLYFGHRGLHAFVPWLFTEASSGLGDAGKRVVRALAYVALFIGSWFVGLLLAQPLSSSALDAIALAARESIQGPTRDLVRTSFATSLFRSIRVTLVTVGVSIAALGTLTVIDFFVPPAAVVTWPLKIVIASFLASWDLFDYAMSLDGLGVRRRTAWIASHRGAAFGFGLTAFGLTLVPFVGLFLLPSAVAGASLLIATENRGRQPTV